MKRKESKSGEINLPFAAMHEVERDVKDEFKARELNILYTLPFILVLSNTRNQMKRHSKE